MRLKQYGSAVQLLKRALEYCWYIKNDEFELMVYDYLGMGYYYWGLLPEAELFHNKFVSGYAHSHLRSALSSPMIVVFDKIT